MSGPAQAFDATQKFVKVTGERNGIIEFEFGMGDLSLAVELMLPPAAFADFCKTNDAIVLEGEGEDTRPLDDAQQAMAWRPSDVQRQL